MAQTCILTGMILKASPAGEFDKRLVILTKERGKITAFAQGARRPKSSMQAATEPFCFGKFEAIEGRDSFRVIKAEISNYFRELALDYDQACYGFYFLEVADYFTQPYNDATWQLKLLYQTLRALGSSALDRRLVRVIYELKTLVYYGVSPNVFSCVSCGTGEGLKFFQLEKRGTLCTGCRGKMAAYKLSEADLYTLQYIVSTSIEKLYTFRVTEEVYQNIRHIVEQYFNLYVDRAFKTLPFLPEE